MKLLGIILLALIILGIPTFALTFFGSGFGSLSSLSLNLLLIVYYIFSEKRKPIMVFIFLGLLYYSISGIFFSGEINILVNESIKYFIFIICASELALKTNQNEIVILFLIGAISILVHTISFPNIYGRYSGFYLNPNAAGFICLIGFAFTYHISKIKYRLLTQFVFTMAGIMTLSRYFILILFLVIVVSIFANRKNAIGLLVGSLGLIIILGTTSIKLNAERFSALKSIFSDEVDTETITKESRDETWALYSTVILDSPILGNGFKSMHGRENDTVGIKEGVHNSYLMVLGESGIIPFLVLVFIYIALFIRSIRHFSTNPEFVYLSIILLTHLMVSHNLFDNYIVLLISIWLYIKVKNKPILINSLNQI